MYNVFMNFYLPAVLYIVKSNFENCLIFIINNIACFILFIIRIYDTATTSYKYTYTRNFQINSKFNCKIYHLHRAKIYENFQIFQYNRYNNNNNYNTNNYNR